MENINIRISSSKLRKITSCMYQYKLYYIDGWRRIQDKAIYRFGHICHETVTRSIAEKFKHSPSKLFASKWSKEVKKDLHYNNTDSFDKFMNLGKTLCAKIPEALQGITRISNIEDKFEVGLSGIQLNGYVDFICDYKDKRTLLDIKTLKSTSPYEVKMSDQLTLYSMAKQVPNVGIIAMYKVKKDPRIEIITGRKTKQDYMDLQYKIKNAVSDIARKYYPKANNRLTCNMCDYVPICFGTKKEVKAKLRQIDTRQHTKKIEQKRKKLLFW
jgi:CRISPR/Cas system-associated exonuclease Cas4 (RecB family)